MSPASALQFLLLASVTLSGLMTSSAASMTSLDRMRKLEFGPETCQRCIDDVTLFFSYLAMDPSAMDMQIDVLTDAFCSDNDVMGEASDVIECQEFVNRYWPRVIQAIASESFGIQLTICQSLMACVHLEQPISTFPFAVDCPRCVKNVDLLGRLLIEDTGDAVTRIKDDLKGYLFCQRSIHDDGRGQEDSIDKCQRAMDKYFVKAASALGHTVKHFDRQICQEVYDTCDSSRSTTTTYSLIKQH